MSLKSTWILQRRLEICGTNEKNITPYLKWRCVEVIEISGFWQSDNSIVSINLSFRWAHFVAGWSGLNVEIKLYQASTKSRKSDAKGAYSLRYFAHCITIFSTKSNRSHRHKLNSVCSTRIKVTLLKTSCPLLCPKTTSVGGLGQRKSENVGTNRKDSESFGFLCIAGH